MSQFLNEDQWVVSNCWVACFDILGFRSLISFEKDDELKIYEVQLAYQKTLKHLEKRCSQYREQVHIDYCWFSDTFLIFSQDDSDASYIVITSASKWFIQDCTRSGIPMRGAISVGQFVRNLDNRAFMGKAFLEAFEYAEDQDWIGLIMTPNAIQKAESYGLYPTHHDFVQSKSIPMHKRGNDDLVAYRFQNGASNQPSLLVRGLHSMKVLAPLECQGKYDRTAKFIEEHYRWIGKQ